MKHLKLFFALFAMLALGVGNAWAETIFSDEFANVGTTASATVSSRTGWSGFSKCYGQYNSGLRLGTGSATGSITKTAMTNIEGTTTLTVTFYLAKYNSDSGKMNITVSGGGTASTTTFTPAGNAGVTSTTSKATWTDTYKCTFTIENATSATTIKFATSSKRLILGPVTISTPDADPDDPEIPATTYTVTVDGGIQNGTVSADVAEAAEGATVTLTADPDPGYKFSAWDVKDASSNAVSVDANGKFTMPASNVIVSASFVAKTQYTIKWNVAEGSVDDTKVYEGDALGKLPTAANCPSGKVFVGWTEVTSVKADGSDITYAKSTDVPDGNKEYNAVYATLSGSADKVDNLDLS